MRIIGVPVYTDPQHLQEVTYANAYPDEDDPPVANTIVGLETMMAKMPMRSTHGSLAPRAGSGSEHFAAVAACGNGRVTAVAVFAVVAICLL